MCLSGVRVESLNAVGGGKHLRMRLNMGDAAFESIFFSHTAAELGLHVGDRVDVAFSPQINTYRGHSSVQLLISAVRKHESSELCMAILESDASVIYAAAPYCPSRADFIRVWRGLADDFSVPADTAAVIAGCPEGMEAEKYCICLMVLLETGLLKSRSGGIYGACRSHIGGKADLESTRLIKALRRERR